MGRGSEANGSPSQDGAPWGPTRDVGTWGPTLGNNSTVAWGLPQSPRWAYPNAAIPQRRSAPTLLLKKTATHGGWAESAVHTQEDQTNHSTSNRGIFCFFSCNATADPRHDAHTRCATHATA